MLAMAVTTLLAVGALQAATQPPSYDGAVRCAGLTQAASFALSSLTARMRARTPELG